MGFRGSPFRGGRIQFRGGRCPKHPGIASCEAVAIDADLVVDELEVLLDLLKLGFDEGAMGLHESESFVFVPTSGGDKLGVAPDRPDGHACGA